LAKVGSGWTFGIGTASGRAMLDADHRGFESHLRNRTEKDSGSGNIECILTNVLTNTCSLSDCILNENSALWSIYGDSHSLRHVPGPSAVAKRVVCRLFAFVATGLATIREVPATVLCGLSVGSM